MDWIYNSKETINENQIIIAVLKEYPDEVTILMYAPNDYKNYDFKECDFDANYGGIYNRDDILKYKCMPNSSDE